MGLLALARATDPHCPKCKGKPTADQHELTENEIGNLSGHAANQVRAKAGLAFECGISMRIKRRQAHPELGPAYELQTYACFRCGQIRQRDIATPGSA